MTSFQTHLICTFIFVLFLGCGEMEKNDFLLFQLGQSKNVVDSICNSLEGEGKIKRLSIRQSVFRSKNDYYYSFSDNKYNNPVMGELYFDYDDDQTLESITLGLTSGAYENPNNSLSSINRCIGINDLEFVKDLYRKKYGAPSEDKPPFFCKWKKSRNKEIAIYCAILPKNESFCDTLKSFSDINLKYSYSDDFLMEKSRKEEKKRENEI